MLTNPVIASINQQQMLDNRPEFKVGDTVAVVVRVIEGDKERLQTFQGVVIAKNNRGLHSSFIVRKISHGVGVERTFPTHSRMIQDIRLVRTGAVRQAKIYYMRERSGKSARIAERFDNKPAAKQAAVSNNAPHPAAATSNDAQDAAATAGSVDEQVATQAESAPTEASANESTAGKNAQDVIPNNVPPTDNKDTESSKN